MTFCPPRVVLLREVCDSWLSEVSQLAASLNETQVTWAFAVLLLIAHPRVLFSAQGSNFYPFILLNLRWAVSWGTDSSDLCLGMQCDPARLRCLQNITSFLHSSSSPTESSSRGGAQAGEVQRSIFTLSNVTALPGKHSPSVARVVL